MIERERERERERETDRHTDRQTHTQTDREREIRDETLRPLEYIYILKRPLYSDLI
jgi:hypothetical protein